MKRASAGSCGGAWYGVGRLNYSLQDVRLTDAILGLEYDAGCWIGRVVAERLSTGTTEATSRLLVKASPSRAKTTGWRKSPAASGAAEMSAGVSGRL